MKQLLKRITDWEHWPFKVLYAPIFPVWLWYIFRSGAVWFFTPSNPKLTFGGMEGEPKREMHDLLPMEHCPVTFDVLPSQPFEFIKERILNNNIIYPLIVKPEVGGQGILFRKIDNEEQLKNYHQKIPVEYIIQEMVAFPMEVSVFHYRYPNNPEGVTTGFLHKIPLQVIGDGKQTLHQLIMNHPKACKREVELKEKHKSKLERILEKDEKYMLSYAANHNRGAQFINLQNEIDKNLTAVFDKISNSIKDFFYGRYDIMCNSIEELKQGKNFMILEYNGCGAEPNHFYDSGYTLPGAYREILKHWKVLFEISRYNNRQGVKYWSFLRGYKFLSNSKKHYRLMREADKNI